MYGTFEDEDEVPPATKPRVVVLGSGPNRIGQGIEFDYCCVHASFALQSAGYETVMVNCNPETVSTDYDTSDRLYFEPLTIEDVMAVVDAEQPEAVIVQLGGQTPLNLAKELERRGVPIAGTSPSSIETAEDREQFSALVPPPRDQAAAPRNRPLGPRRRRSGRPGRASGRDPTLVRARRAQDAGHLQLRRALGVSHRSLRLGGRFRSHRGAPPHRSVPRSSHRGRCRRHLRWPRTAGRRDHGARRGSRSPLRRLGLCHPATDAVRGGLEADHGRGRGAGPGPRGAGIDQHPVRSQGQRSLRARGQSPRFADGAFHLQGVGHPARQGGGPGDDGSDPRTTSIRRRPHRARRQRLRGGQGGGAALGSVPRRGHRARSGDALHR